MQRPQLEALASRLGILPAYHDLAGREQRASDATREALIAAMGHDASSEQAAASALARLAAETRQRLLEPVQVWRESAAGRPRIELRAGRGAWSGRLELHEERGQVHLADLALISDPEGRASLELPARLGPGYHRVRVELADGRAGEQRLIVAPRTAPTARELLRGRRAFGVAANLYSVRGERGLGCGDTTDLAQLLELVGGWGGDFVGLNPLHALRNRGESISPYSPVSRLWRNLCYIDVERVPEFERCAAARELLGGRATAALVTRLQAAQRLEHEQILELKLSLLRELHASFRRGEAPAAEQRAAHYARFVEAGGVALRDHATFEALAERRPAQPDWRTWPAELRDPRSAAVAEFRAREGAALDLQSWIQFELDRQLAEAARSARAAGLALGILNDLAVGSPPDSADAWAQPELLARGVSIGAPPDAFTLDGQRWGLSPIDPNRLRAEGYRLWTQLLRACFQHAGGLRIDHAIGLERSFWIPEGRPSSEGAYVLQPAEDLLGILALEARRAGALVIGEDLGVVPVGLKRRLASWGVISTSVLLFERDEQGFRAPASYSPRALVTATTHDLVPLDGYAEGTDLRLRAQLGQAEEAALEAELEQRRRDVRALSHGFEQAQVASFGAADGLSVERAHSFLAGTPSPLLALALDDLAGEREPINLPGISTGRHRSWSRRMTRPLSAIHLDADSIAQRSRAVGDGSRRALLQDDAT